MKVRPDFLLPIIASGLAFAGLACVTPDNTIDVVHDPCAALALVVSADATARERESVTEAAALWNALGWTDVSVVEDAESAVRIEFREAPMIFLGLYEDETSQVFVNRGLSDDRARAITVAHELGHAMGLDHVEKSERPSIMNTGNVDVAPTAEDERALLLRWNECAAATP